MLCTLCSLCVVLLCVCGGVWANAAPLRVCGGITGWMNPCVRVCRWPCVGVAPSRCAWMSFGDATACFARPHFLESAPRRPPPPSTLTRPRLGSTVLFWCPPQPCRAACPPLRRFEGPSSGPHPRRTAHPRWTLAARPHPSCAAQVRVMMGRGQRVTRTSRGWVDSR